MTPIDLSCDLGEASSVEEREIELALWPLVDAANVACGGHAGDDASMREAVALALRHRVTLGAHPSFPDREGFGRRKLEISPDELVASLTAQIASLRRAAEASGVVLERVKAHGALYNLAHRDLPLAESIARATSAAAPAAAVVSPAGSAMEGAAIRLGLRVLREAFADRRYAADGTLVPRGEPGSLLEDAGEAARQAVALATRGMVLAADGSEIAVAHDTICVHADMQGAAGRLRAVRAALASAGVKQRRMVPT